jgi:TonB-linked SusC/RagA family outer membrane protein
MKLKLLLLALCLPLLAIGIAHAQERTVTGKVTSAEEGTPIPGVNVTVKGVTPNGTVTDADGKYAIQITDSKASLVFSFVGLKTQEVVVGDRSIVDIQLSLDVHELSEVVVSALGLELKRDEVGTATSQITGNAVARSGEATLINGLSGKASGVNIVRSSGDPGAGSYIQIRGQSTITGNLQPLIILDGMPISNSTLGNSTDGVVQQSRLNDLNPDDIESLEILKGASAAALWGTRAANGVIVIKTKRGSSQKGKINISFKSTYSVDKIYLTHDLTKNWSGGTLMQYRFTPPSGLSWGDYIPGRSGGPDTEIKTGAYFEAADGTRFYPIANGTAASPHGGKNSRQTYDYRDYLFKTGSYWDNSVSLSGGDADGNFFLSISNISQDGIIVRNSNYDKTTFRVNAMKKLSNLFRISSNFNYSRVTSDRVQMGSNTSGLYLGGLRTSPDFNSNYYIGKYVDANGVVFANRQRAYRNPIGASTRSVYDNPLYTIDYNQSRSEVDRFIAGMELTASPKAWLDITARVGLDNYADRRKDFFDPLSSTIPNGRLTLQTVRETQFNADIFGTARAIINQDLTLNSVLGMNFNARQFDNVGGTAQNFIIASEIPEDLGNAAPANTRPFNGLSYIRTAAVYSSIDLAYKDMLFLNVTGRGESASTFGKNATSTFFYPAANLAWQFHKLISNSGPLSFGKLRAGFGVVGVQPGPYSTATYYAAGGYGEGWGPALASGAYGAGGYTESSVLGNNKLRPERKTEIEFGGDFRLFSDRISLGITYFQNETKDAILSVATAPSTGFTSKTGNAATLENKGIEIDLGAEILRIGDFRWRIDANFTRLRNKVTDLAGTESLFLAGFTGTSSRAVEGYPIGVLWGSDFKRDTEGGLVLDARGFPQQASQESVLGNPNPDWKGGLGNTFTYKGFRLYVLLETTQGGQIWAGTSGIMNHFGRSKETDVLTTVSAAEAATLNVYAISGSASTTVANRYPANPDGTYTFRGKVVDFGGGPVALDQGWYTSLGGGFGPVSSQFLRDITNTRIREITLSYSLTSKGFRKVTKLNSIDFSITGRNLLIVGPDVKKIGNDPETNLTGPTNGRGLEYFNNPSTRSYLFSVTINY